MALLKSLLVSYPLQETFFNFSILNPAATIKKPPQALKSAIISGVVNGTIKLADKNNVVKITNCGTAISETIYPKLHANIAAVKKSKIDLSYKQARIPSHTFT